MSPTPPTDAELDVLIRARLAAVGIDLDQLPSGSAADPVTGSPGRDTALASLRSFVRTTVTTISAYQPAADGVAAQRVTPPALYPSIDTARRA
jgi:hypothetical protein